MSYLLMHSRPTRARAEQSKASDLSHGARLEQESNVIAVPYAELKVSALEIERGYSVVTALNRLLLFST
jgi:hypothetical protein